MSAVVETLKAARALLTPEGAWTQGCLARNLKGKSVEPNDPDAVCWCASGAIGKATLTNPLLGRDDTEIWSKACRAVIPYKGLITEWNDSRYRTRVQVLAAFDEAIRRAEAA